MFTTLLPVVGLEFNILILIAIGFAVGVLAGFFGIGGGWIITPSLHVFGFPMAFAIGTELANITGQSALALAKHQKMGNVDYKLGAIVGMAMVGGVEGGKRLIVALESWGVVDSVVRLLYVMLLGGLGVFMLYEYATGAGRRNRGKDGGVEDPPAEGAVEAGDSGILSKLMVLPPVVEIESCEREVSLFVLLGAGLIVGFLAGMMGSGGGFALVPLFVFVIGVPTYVAVSTSLVCVAIAGTYGTFTYALQGRVELSAAFWIFAGAAVGTQFGGSAVRYVRGYGVRLLYAVMLVLAAVSVLMKHLGLAGPAAVMVLGGALLMCAIIIGRMLVGIVRQRRVV